MPSIRVTKYDTRGAVIAETRVETLQAANAFLDSLDSDGNPLPPKKKEPAEAEATVPG